MKPTRRLRRIAVTAVLAASSLPLGAPRSVALATPRTLQETITLPLSAPEKGSNPAGVSAALPFAATHLAFSWRGEESPGPEIRTSRDGQEWSPWAALESSEDLADHAARVWYTDLYPGGDARFVQARGPGSPGLRVNAMNTRDGPLRRIAVPAGALAAPAQPPVVSRAEWGADESIRRAPPGFAPITRLFVHHTVTPNDDPDPAGTVRAIYANHVLFRGWNDIGYNFLIDSSGRIYEGRWARDYLPGEQPTGEDTAGQGVVGAHVTSYNEGSAGIALLGDFRSSMPSPPAMSSLVAMLAWKAGRHEIPARGRTSDGVPNLAGHRDAGATACPGDVLYAQLPQIREEVEARAGSFTTGPPSAPADLVLSPAGVGTTLTPALTGSTSASGAYVEVFFDGTGATSDRTVVVPVRSGRFSLAAADFAGTGLRRDRYAVKVTAYDASGRPSPAALASGAYPVVGPDAPNGYWVAAQDGSVGAFGGAPFLGSMAGRKLNSPVVAMDAVPDGSGYWMLAADGGIFSFGAARFWGSTGGMKLNKPVAGMAPTPSGNGYWLVASDGGIFAFGDAGFFGSTGAIRLNQPIVGMAATLTGNGYWLVASDGGIFAFGDAGFFGSTGAIRLNKPIVGMAPTRTSDGYLLVASDGGIFAFGAARYAGSLPEIRSGAGAAKIKTGAVGGGYYVLAPEGSLFTFGGAPFFGAPSEAGLRRVADLAVSRG